LHPLNPITHTFGLLFLLFLNQPSSFAGEHVGRNLPTPCLITILTTSLFEPSGEPSNSGLSALDGSRFRRTELRFNDVGIDSNYVDSIRNLRRQLGSTVLQKLNEVKVAIYPFYGTDSATPFLFFPNLIMSVAIDENPFTPNLDAFANEYFPHVQGLRQTQVNSWKDPRRAGKIIGGLSVPFPNFRLRRVFLFSSGQAKSAIFDRPAIHAIIEFDDGPETPLRRHLHLNRSIVDESSFRFDQKTLTVLDAFNPEAIIGRGAMGALHHRFANRTPRGLSFGDWIHNWDFEHNLVRVEGRLESEDGWEISGFDTEPPNVDDVSVTRHMPYGFGYGHKINISFKGSSSNNRVVRSEKRE
jgi:hypothetical protein